MNNPQIIAVSKAISDKVAKAAREGLAVGRHEIDITVRIHGSMNVGEDTEKTPTVSIPMKETLAWFIHHAGITGPHAANLLARAMQSALAENDEGEQNPNGTGALLTVKPMIENIMDTTVAAMLESLPKTKVKGSVRASLKVDEVAELATV